MSKDSCPDAQHLGEILTYWGSMSRQQAIYYLGKFWQRHPAEKIVELLISRRYICELHGDREVISCTNNPFESFSKGKEKCLWVFFRYLHLFFFKGKELIPVTKNEMGGIDFIIGDPDPESPYGYKNGQFYSICYVSPDDLTYRTLLLKTHRDEEIIFVYVCDSKEDASKVIKINDNDKIWYVSDKDNTINLYKSDGEE